MNAFLDSLRADLLDRRMRPLLALLGLALLGAVAYAALSGSGSSTPAATSAPASVAGTSGIAVSAVEAEGPQAVAETTNGTGQQTGGATRNPFTPLSEPKALKAAASSAASTSSGSGSSSSGAAGSGSSSSSGSSKGSGSETKPSVGSGGTSPSKPKSEHAKPQTVYDVSVLFGKAAPGTPLASAQLTPYDELVRQQPLPSAQQALVVFRGVIAGGKSATFTLVGEAILRGVGACLPSASQCQAIDLQAGQTEELEFAQPGAPATTYMLHVVSIKTGKATAKGARRALAGESKSGLRLLRSIGLDALPGLRYSGTQGVLVFPTRSAFGARAQIAALHVLGSAAQRLSASK